MHHLANKVVVVTGAFGALGRAVVDEARSQGANVAMLGHRAAEAPAGSMAWQVELESLEDTSRVFAEIASHFGRIDALANIAGAFRFQTLAASQDLREWDELHRSNVITCVNACKAALPHLGKGAAIVNIGATGALHGTAGMGAYAASKAGVMRFTEALADELGGKGIRVNAVLPSIIDTPANRADMPKADTSTWVQPRDIARVIAFLISDAASAVSGALVPVTAAS